MTRLPGDSPRVALMQPTFMPWLGYFGLMRDADLFVFLDNFQYVRRSFQSRNRLFCGGAGVGILSVPVQHEGTQEIPLNRAVPAVDDRFRRHTLTTLAHNYSKCKGYAEVYPVIESWLGQNYSNLAAMNMALIERLAGLLGYGGKFRLSSACRDEGRRSERLASLLRAVGAKTYLAARGSFSYMKEDGSFPIQDCQIYFQDFQPQPYKQRQSNSFQSHLSVVDTLLQIGPEATRVAIAAGQQPYWSWEGMMQADISHANPSNRLEAEG